MKTILTLIAVIVIALGAYYWYASQSTALSMTPSAETVSSTSGSSALPTGTQTSNSALNQDLSAIDSQISGLGADTANVSQSLNDQPVTQPSI